MTRTLDYTTEITAYVVRLFTLHYEWWSGRVFYSAFCGYCLLLHDICCYKLPPQYILVTKS